MASPQELLITLRDLHEDHERLFSEHKVLTGMLRKALENQAVITDNQAVLREDLSAIESKLDAMGPKVDSLERKLYEVVALIREIRAL